MGARDTDEDLLRWRLAGKTVREIAGLLALSQPTVYRRLARVRARLQRHAGELEQAEYHAQQERVREVRLLVHLMCHDIEELGVVPEWRRATVGPPPAPRQVGIDGRLLMPRAAPFRAEDIIEEGA